MKASRHCTAILLIAVTSLLTACASADEYAIDFTARLDPNSGTAAVSLHVTQDKHLLRTLKLRAPAELFADFQANGGSVERSADRVTWTIPETGGTLHYSATLNVPKGSGFDARSTADWALLRFEDLLPPLHSRARKGSKSKFTVTLSGPPDWSFETRYGRWQGKPLRIRTTDKNLDRPTGWLLAGKLGVRREPIEGMDVTVAAPTGTRFPRIPTLAFLRWTMPDFAAVFPKLPERLLIVSGDDAMWRGALSGPESLFLHRARPLISENGTSPLLHELVHVATRMSAATGDDWIVEGLAEYYSLEILRRSDGLSQRRFDAALDDMRQWVKTKNGKLTDPSKGVDTAAAVLLFAELAKELAGKTPGEPSSDKTSTGLDAVVADLSRSSAGRTRVSRSDLATSVQNLLGHKSRTLSNAKLP